MRETQIEKRETQIEKRKTIHKEERDEKRIGIEKRTKTDKEKQWRMLKLKKWREINEIMRKKERDEERDAKRDELNRRVNEEKEERYIKY